MKTLLIIFAVLLFSGCAAIKWSLTYQGTTFCVCANVDSLSFSKMTTTALAKSLTEQQGKNLTPAMIDSLIKALDQLKIK